MGHDLKFAVRRLLATPLFTVFAILSLAAGLGVTTVVYSVVRSIFMKDAGIRRSDEVVFVAWPRRGRVINAQLSLADFRDLRDAQRSLANISASAILRSAVSSDVTSELETVEAVDGAYFATLGVTPVLGRAIRPADEADAARVAVLSDTLWRKRFGTDPAVVGRSIRVGGELFDVIGVAQPSFAGPTTSLFGTALWIPLTAEPASVQTPWSGVNSSRGTRRLTVFGRLAPGVAVARASTELASIASRLDERFPPPPLLQRAGQSERAWSARPASAPTEEEISLRRFAYTLTGFVALVLVVACTNLANLSLARGSARKHEFAVREALGAPRWRLVRELFAESLLLATAGAIMSFIVFRGLQLLMTADFMFPLPGGGRWTLAIRPELDVTAATFAAASLLGALVIFGLEPALALTRDVRGSLAQADGGPARTARHQLLLRWQVAIACGFFIIATMFVKYTIAEARHDSGVEMDRLAVAVMNLEARAVDKARLRRTVDRLLTEARKNPELEGLSVSTGLPFGGSSRPLSVSLAMADGGTGTSDFHASSAIAATPAVFKTIGVPILRGRAFDDRDSSTPVVVLSEFAARRVFGSTDVVGRQVIVRDVASRERPATVIGIARNTDVGSIFADPRPFAYLPLSDPEGPMLTVAARGTIDAAQAVRVLRQTLYHADPDTPIDVIGTGRSILAGPFVFARAMGITVLALGLLTLLLAMVGLFGIQSHVVTARTREIGVRMSFGASAAQIQRMILKDGARPVLSGLAIGLLIGLAGRGIVRYETDLEISIVDPWMLVVVPVPLILAGVCACYLPAQRAAAVDPNIALKSL